MPVTEAQKKEQEAREKAQKEWEQQKIIEAYMSRGWPRWTKISGFTEEELAEKQEKQANKDNSLSVKTDGWKKHRLTPGIYELTARPDILNPQKSLVVEVKDNSITLSNMTDSEFKRAADEVVAMLRQGGAHTLHIDGNLHPHRLQMLLDLAEKYGMKVNLGEGQKKFMLSPEGQKAGYGINHKMMDNVAQNLNEKKNKVIDKITKNVPGLSKLEKLKKVNLEALGNDTQFKTFEKRIQQINEIGVLKQARIDIEHTRFDSHPAMEATKFLGETKKDELIKVKGNDPATADDFKAALKQISERQAKAEGRVSDLDAVRKEVDAFNQGCNTILNGAKNGKVNEVSQLSIATKAVDMKGKGEQLIQRLAAEVANVRIAQVECNNAIADIQKILQQHQGKAAKQAGAEGKIADLNNKITEIKDVKEDERTAQQKDDLVKLEKQLQTQQEKLKQIKAEEPKQGLANKDFDELNKQLNDLVEKNKTLEAKLNEKVKDEKGNELGTREEMHKTTQASFNNMIKSMDDQKTQLNNVQQTRKLV